MHCPAGLEHGLIEADLSIPVEGLQREVETEAGQEEEPEDAASWGKPPAPPRPTRSQATAGPCGRDAGAPLLSGIPWLHCAGHPGNLTLTSDDEFLFRFPHDVKLFWSCIGGDIGVD